MTKEDVLRSIETAHLYSFSPAPSQAEMQIINRLIAKIDAAIGFINREGAQIDPCHMSAEEYELVVQYTEWLLLPGENRGVMPRSLRYGLNNLIFGGGGHV